MKTILDHTNFLETETECVLRLLNDWQPSKGGLSEKAYEQELDAWLSSQLPEVPIVAQYGIAKGDADIVIHDSFVIELKLGFVSDRLTEFDRCIGQLERYRQKWVDKDRGKVFLVIVGKSEPEFRGMILKAIERLNEKYLFGNFFYLIEKYC